MLHVSQDDPNNPNKRINKISDLLEFLIPRYQKYYSPSQRLSVDETMVGFRGRFEAIQYIKDKPTKWGIKAFTLADGLNGYLLDTLVYTGADMLEGSDPQYEDLSIPGRVVMHLMDPYLEEGYHIFTDRYYSSVPLVQALEQRNTTFTGTIMRNRTHLPDPIRDSSFRLSGGEVVAYRHERMLVLGWQAEGKKKPLVMLSSAGTTDMVEIQPRNQSKDPVPQASHR